MLLSAGGDGNDCQVLPAIGNSADCPEGMERTPGMCQIQEVINFSPEATVHGCRCLNITDCGAHSPFKGHSWCEVDTGDSDCGTRYTGSYGRHARRWDFCMMTGAPLKAMLGFDNATRNDFLASFIPNEHAGEGHSLLPSATQVISKYDTVAYRDTRETGLSLLTDTLMTPANQMHVLRLHTRQATSSVWSCPSGPKTQNSPLWWTIG